MILNILIWINDFKIKKNQKTNLPIIFKIYKLTKAEIDMILDSLDIIPRLKLDIIQKCDELKLEA